MHVPVRHLRELRHPPAHVRAARVEPLALRHRVEHPVGPGVGAGARHPLPVELIVGDVPVHQKVEEVPGAHPPVRVQRLGQEARRQHPAPVVHPPLVPQLPHRRVHQRIARTPRTPGRDLPGVLAPPVTPRPVVGPGRLGPGREHLVMEVAPGDLPYERLGAGPRPLPRPLHRLGRRDRAEVQIRREAGGGVARQVVVAGLVPGQAAGTPRPQQPPSLRLAARGQPLRDPRDLRPGRQRLARHIAGHAYRARGADGGSYALLTPAPEIRCEHGVVVAAGGRQPTGRDGRHHRVVRHQLAADLLERGPQPLLAPQRVAAHPGRDVQPGRSYGSRDGTRPVHHVAAPEHQVTAARAERGVQVGEAVGEERAPVRRVEPGVAHPVVRHEQRDDLVGLAQRGAQHRVVVHAQVGGEQHHGNAHASGLLTGGEIAAIARLVAR